MAAKQHVFIVIAVALIPILNAKDIGCGSASKPDFKVAGQRISEEKCREYTWERSNLYNCSQEAANTEYPYMGAIGYRRQDEKELSFLCGAFLISPKFAVSVSYCFKSAFKELVPEIVRFGNKDLTAEPHFDAKIRRSIVHPEYKAPIRAFDLALVEFEEALPLSRSIQPVCLWAKSSLEGIAQGNAPGWGRGPRKEAGKTDLIMTLQVMTVKVPNRESCKSQVEKYYNRKWPQLFDHQICGDEADSPVHLCLGSAGVPLITTGDLDGVQVPYAFAASSFGGICPGGFAIYTSVPSFIEWIEQTVWPQNTK